MLKKTPLATPRANRSTHTVKAGESLASIALKHYGDARFARLLTTINRGDVQTRSDGFSEFAFVFPGLLLCLPTYEEANIFNRHFFTEKSHSKFDLAHFARPAMPSDSIPMDILPTQGSRSPNNMVLPSVQSLPQPFLSNGAPQSAPNFSPNSQTNIPAIGNVRSANVNQFDCQFIVKREGQGEQPNQAEKMVALTKMPAPERVIDMSPPTVSVARLQSEDALPEGPQVVSLSHYCRMIKFEVEGGQSDTIIKLQVLEETRWQTITAYIITEEKSRRLAHYADKNNRAIQIDLPCEVAKELSISDLKRNWQQYVQVYLNTQAKLTSFAAPQDNQVMPAY